MRGRFHLSFDLTCVAVLGGLALIKAATVVVRYLAYDQAGDE